MILSIWDTLQKYALEFERFIITNYDEPFLWIGIFVFLLAICYFAISSLANK